jgi:HEPN domain-containing protein
MKNYSMAKEWLKASNYDLEVIREILKNRHLTHMSAFHAQQSLEKSLKAILEFHNQKVPKIHNIKKLLNLTKEYISFDTDIDTIIQIDTLYIESRYPGDMGLLPYGQPTLNDAKEFYKFANDIFDKVCNILDVDKQELKG